jgi:hypothetical protein
MGCHFENNLLDRLVRHVYLFWSIKPILPYLFFSTVTLLVIVKATCADSVDEFSMSWVAVPT